ncbi:MAG TPA: hypothetical protein VGE93_00410 [Bryobacteraceae bacterium]
MNSWHSATGQELKTIIPARALIEKEHIETEFRSASGIVNGQGEYIAGAVLITAGYSTDGKYSHFLTTEVSLKIGALRLRPGEYALGYRHNKNGLDVTFYETESGKLLGHVEAIRRTQSGKLESFRINCDGDHGRVEIGRFGIPYKICPP